MKAVQLIILAGLVVLFPSCSTAAPLAPRPAVGSGLDVKIERIDITHFPLIYTFFSVIDPIGRAVNQFERRSFEISENAFRCKIELFRLDRSPLSVALLMDCSGSMQSAILDLKRALAHFIRVLEPYDQALLMAFADIPKILVPFTFDQDKLVTALGPVEAYGPTALYDSIYKAALELSPMPGRRVVVLMTDGQDQNAPGTAYQSRHSLQDALALAIQNHVVIHVVALGKWVNVGELEKIVLATKGVLYRVARSQDLEALYMLISRNLKSHIELTYRSPNPRVDGSWRVFEAKVTAGGSYGSAQASYRAPGRYIVEVPGQGFDHLRREELAHEVPPVRVRDLNLKELFVGGKRELAEWLETYFHR